MLYAVGKHRLHSRREYGAEHPPKVGKKGMEATKQESIPNKRISVSLLKKIKV
jgi:hypothetical protein